VEEDVRVGSIHPDGRGIADEMDVVPASGEFLAKLGRNHS
jgi:hypothetical protein